MMAIVAAELAQVIERVLTDPDNKIGGNLLGTYTYENDVVLPAITVGNPGGVIKAEGLEVVIPLMPSTSDVGMTDEINRVARWDITLLQRDPVPLRSPTLPDAIDRLNPFFAFSFGGEISGVFVDADTVLGSYPQYSFSFFEDTAIDTSRLVRQFLGGI